MLQAVSRRPVHRWRACKLEGSEGGGVMRWQCSGCTGRARRGADLVEGLDEVVVRATVAREGSAVQVDDVCAHGVQKLARVRHQQHGARPP